MGDAVTTNVVFSGNKRLVTHLTNVSDSTGEDGVVKVDISELVGLTGAAPDSLVLEEIEWDVQGFTSVTLAWDADADDTMVVLSGNGYKDYRGHGGLKDPQSTGATGDVLLTTAGAAAGATYDITAHFRLKG